MNPSRLLVHTCCAPCLVYVHDKLNEMNISFDTYFYNPNIHPIQEHKKRLKYLSEYTNDFGIKLITDTTFLQDMWHEDFKCEDCYKLRLENTAIYAKNNGYDAFTTTLLVSIYQNHEKIREICYDLSNKYDIDYFYHDFRVGYREGQNKARETGLYRQKYCGCINSYDKSKFKDKITWD